MQVRTFIYTLRGGRYLCEDGYTDMDSHIQRMAQGGWELLNSAADTGHVRVGKTLAVGALTGGLSLLFGGSRTDKTITLTFKTDRAEAQVATPLVPRGTVSAPRLVPLQGPQPGMATQPSIRNGYVWVLLLFAGAVVVGVLAYNFNMASQSVTAHNDNPVSAPPTTERRDTSAVDLSIRTYYTAVGSPCAVDRSTARIMVRALLDKDTDALSGLEDSGKALFLKSGTKFEGLDFPNELVLGYVKSGRNVGKKCYILKIALQETPPQ